MTSVIIKRDILLKAIVTESLREEVTQELQQAADDIARRIEELDVAGKRYFLDLQRSDLQRAMAVRQQVEAEKKRQQELRDRLLQRKEEVAQWQNGEEVVRGTLEGFVEVNEGDNLAVILGGTEMVVEDDVIKAIRERPAEELRSVVSAALREAKEAEPDNAAATPIEDA